MTAYPYRDLTNQWNTEHRFEAVIDVDVLIVNTGRRLLHWTHSDTGDDTLPIVAVVDAATLPPGTSQTLRLRLGDRLWFGGDQARFTLEVLPSA